ncbi:MAG TPA: ester cyclase [Vicinamibacterales bacterium]|nr:ester cyclase [Vicinamibacterales bacterium]
MDTDADLLRRYYAAFNDRRLDEAASLFTADAVVEHFPGSGGARGPDGYRAAADTWLRGFPDLHVTIERVSTSRPHMHEVDLVATGTHTGPFELAGRRFRPLGVKASLHLRELLEVGDGRFTFASVSFDLQDLVHQLTRIDVSALVDHIHRIHDLGDQLAASADDAPRRTRVLDRLGLELDAARRVIRPYFGS